MVRSSERGRRVGGPRAGNEPRIHPGERGGASGGAIKLASRSKLLGRVGVVEDSVLGESKKEAAVPGFPFGRRKVSSKKKLGRERISTARVSREEVKGARAKRAKKRPAIQRRRPINVEDWS